MEDRGIQTRILKDRMRHKAGVYETPSSNRLNFYATTNSVHHGSVWERANMRTRSLARPSTTGSMNSGYVTGHHVRAVGLGSTLHSIHTHTDVRTEPPHGSTARHAFVPFETVQPHTDPKTVTNRFYQPGGYVGNNKFHGTVEPKPVNNSTYQDTHHHEACNTFPKSRDALGIPVAQVDVFKAHNGYTQGHQPFTNNQIPYHVPHPEFRTTNREFDRSLAAAPANFHFDDYRPQTRSFAFTKSVLQPPAEGVGDKLRESHPVGEPTSRSVHSFEAANHFSQSQRIGALDATGIPQRPTEVIKSTSGYAQGHASLAHHQQPPMVRHDPMVSTYKDHHPPIDETKLHQHAVHENVVYPKSGYTRLHGPFPVPQVYTQQQATAIFKSTSPMKSRSLESTLRPGVERTLRLHDNIAFKNYGAGVVQGAVY